MENIDLENSDQIRGILYKITNKANGFCYIGQTRSHRKNKDKYRYFGHIGRFKDHISEALNNTKKNQCKYLNNAIRQNKDCFIVELLETCELDQLDEKEIHYIETYNSLFPNGYNLTKGGKTTKSIQISLNEDLKDVKKRGRPFGYTHTDETKRKIKENISKVSSNMKKLASTKESKERVSTNIKNYYDDLKIKKLTECDISKDPEHYIKEIKKDGCVFDYKIYINRETRFMVKSAGESLDSKYNRLKNIILKAKELQSKNG